MVIADGRGSPITLPYAASAYLDGYLQYKLLWRADSEAATLYLRVEVNTTGWIGLGFSTTGSMKGADIVMGYVAKGRGFISDRMGKGNFLPTEDTHQDYTLHWAWEAPNGTTFLEISRPIESCDDDDDIDISIGTTKVIWSYSDTDPRGSSPYAPPFFSFATKHTNRGAKAINLLTFHDLAIPDDVATAETAEFRMENNISKPSRTIYWCSAFNISNSILDFDEIETKIHAIKIEVIVDEPNRGELHHMIVYSCTHAMTSEQLAYKGLCSNQAMPTELYTCRGRKPILIWAVGQNPTILPPQAGFPLGPKFATGFVVETHYDNPQRRTFVDKTGFRIDFIRKPREHDAGIFVVGRKTASRTFIVPPGDNGFDIYGYAGAGCTESRFSSTGLHIFGVFQHAHLAATKMTTRLFRGGKELAPLAENPSYDFNFQALHTVDPTRQVLRGDSILTTCTYTTSDKHTAYLKSVGMSDATHNTSFTHGGTSVIDEMCLTYLLHYPYQGGDCVSDRYDTEVAAQGRFRQIKGLWTENDVSAWRQWELNALHYSETPAKGVYALPWDQQLFPPRESRCGNISETSSTVAPQTTTSTPAVCVDDDELMVYSWSQIFQNTGLNCATARFSGQCNTLRGGVVSPVVQRLCPISCGVCPTNTSGCIDRVDDNNAVLSDACRANGIVASFCRSCETLPCSHPHKVIHALATQYCPRTCGVTSEDYCEAAYRDGYCEVGNISVLGKMAKQWCPQSCLLCGKSSEPRRQRQHQRRLQAESDTSTTTPSTIVSSDVCPENYFFVKDNNNDDDDDDDDDGDDGGVLETTSSLITHATNENTNPATTMIGSSLAETSAILTTTTTSMPMAIKTQSFKKSVDGGIVAIVVVVIVVVVVLIIVVVCILNKNRRFSESIKLNIEHDVDTDSSDKHSSDVQKLVAPIHVAFTTSNILRESFRNKAGGQASAVDFFEGSRKDVLRDWQSVVNPLFANDERLHGDQNMEDV